MQVKTELLVVIQAKDDTASAIAATDSFFVQPLMSNPRLCVRVRLLTVEVPKKGRLVCAMCVCCRLSDAAEERPDCVLS